jgi:hypothetical protein
MKPIRVPPYVVYLLHFDEPVGRALHYMGICKVDRLHWRQLEHLRGSGARLTARAAEQGTGWHIVRLWPTADPGLERRLKALGRFSSACNICENRGKSAAPVALGRHYAPKKKTTDWLPKGWS